MIKVTHSAVITYPTTTATAAQDCTTPLKRAPSSSSSSRVSGVASPVSPPDLKVPKPSSPRSGTSSYTPANSTALVEYDTTNNYSNSNTYTKPHNTPTTAIPPPDPYIQHTIEVSLITF